QKRISCPDGPAMPPCRPGHVVSYWVVQHGAESNSRPRQGIELAAPQRSGIFTKAGEQDIPDTAGEQPALQHADVATDQSGTADLPDHAAPRIQASALILEPRHGTGSEGGRQLPLGRK